MLEQPVLETVADPFEARTELEVTLPATHDLPTEDGIPMETPLHRAQMNLCIDLTDYLWRDRTDYYVGGNMFVYFSAAQVRNRDYRGPDFFVVTDVDGTKERDAWVVWEEGGHYPDLIIELLSDSTARLDKTTKKRLYEGTFRTSEYFCYHPLTHEFLGWRLTGGVYDRIQPNSQGHLWSDVLGVWLGVTESRYQRQARGWLRFFDSSGQLVPTLTEAEALAAEQERQRAAEAHQQAEQASQRAAEERQRAEEEAQRATEAHQQAEQASQRAEQASQRAEQEAQRANEERTQREAAQRQAEETRQQLMDTARNLLPLMDDATINQVTGLELMIIQQLRQDNG